MLPARPPLLPPVSPTQLLQHQHQLQQQKHQHFDHHAHHHNHRAVAGLPPRPVLIHQQQPWQPTDPRLSRRSPSSLSSLAAAAAAAATDGVGSHHHLTMPTPPESLSPADCVGASAEAAAAAAQLLALNHTTSSSSSSSLGMWPAQEATSTPPMPPPFLSASMYPEDSDYRYGHLGDQEEDDDGDIGSASCSDADDLEIDSYVPPPRTLFDTALVASTDDLVERSPSPLLMGGGGRDESESPALRIGNSDGNDDEDDEEQQDLPPIGPDGLASRPTNPRKPCTDAEVAALATFSFMDECWYQNSKLGLAEDAMELPCACRYRPDRDSLKRACGDDATCINRVMFMECKPGTCPVGKRCQNRRFQTKSGAPIEVFDADRKGFGLRTLCDLPAGAFVMEYVGDVITHRKFVRRAREYARAGHSHFYFMSLQPDQIIDAQQRGSLARFMNHSCAANCVTQKWVVGDHLRIGIFTTKPVKRGQELTFDYQFARYGDTAQACYCGESVCSGFIGGNSKDTRAAEAVAASMANDVLVNGDAILGDDNDDDDSDMDSDTSSKGGAHKRSRRDRDRQRSRKHQRAGMPARRDDTLDEGTLRRLLLPLVASVDSTTARELALAPSRVDSMLTKLLRIDSKAQKTAVDLNLGLPKVLRCVLDAAREHEALDDADESEEHLAASVGAVDPRSGGPAVTTRRGWAAAAATAAAETLSDVGSSGGSSSGGVDGATRRQTRATRWLRTSLEMLDALPVQTRNTLVAAGLPETMEEIKDHNDDVVSHLARVLAGKWAKLEQVWVIPRREIVPPSATAMDYSNARDEPPIKRMRVSAISTSMIGSHPPMSPASAGSGTPATPFTTVPPWSSSQSSQAPPPPPPLPAPTAPTPWRMYRAPAGYPFPQYYYHPMSSVTRWAQPQHCEIIDAMAKFGPDHRIPPPPPLPAGVFAAPVVSANTDVDDVADIIEAARRAAIEAEARTVRERQEREKTAAEEEEKRRRERRDLRNASSSSRRATSSSTAAGAGTGTKTSSSSSSRSKHHHHGSRSSKPPSKEASKEAAASESVDQIKIVPPPTGSTASATAPSSSATTTKEAYKRHPGWYRQLVSEYVVKQLTVHHRPRKTDPPRTYVHPLGTSDAFKAVARDLAHEILCRESVPDPSRPQLTNLSAALKAKIDKYVAAKVDRLKHTAKKTAKAAGAL